MQVVIGGQGDPLVVLHGAGAYGRVMAPAAVLAQRRIDVLAAEGRAVGTASSGAPA